MNAKTKEEFNRKGAEGAQRGQKVSIGLENSAGHGDRGNYRRKEERTSLFLLSFARLPRLRGFSFLFLVFASISFTACPVEDDGGWAGPTLKVVIPLNSGDAGARYYSLADGEEVTGADIAGQNWDLGFYSMDSTPSIFTNSGATAAHLGSGGQGGVWYSDRALEDAGPEDGKADGEYAAYVADVERWVQVMGPPSGPQRMNIMTYLGYPGGDGLTKDTLFVPNEMKDMGSFVGYGFDKKQFYSWHSMPPVFSPTGQTYIVRHGDGAGRSKIRVADIYPEGYYEYYVFEVQYENF
jgi:hypothetical protein